MCQHFYDQRELRGMRWQGTQGTALKRQARGNRISAPGHGALLIGKATRSQIGIDRLQSRSLWKRHEVIPPSIPDQIFDASFLPAGMHIGKERDPRDRHFGNAEIRHALVGYALAAPGEPLA